MRKVEGMGINDSQTYVQKFEYLGYVNGKKKSKLLWICPHYAKWKDMLVRCYSTTKHKAFPNYKDCFVCEDWLLFSKFKIWSISQGMSESNSALTLDKDLLVVGNKEYSPENCVYVPNKINTFILDNKLSRGDCPLGVNLNKSKTRYEAWCRNPHERRNMYLGVYDCPQLAHLAWKQQKLIFAKELIAECNLPENVSKSIIARYS